MTAATKAKAKEKAPINNLDTVSNDAEEDIRGTEPYRVEVTIEGVCPILFHRYSVEAVAEKAAAKKNSKAKKTDNIESYVYRNTDGDICVPGIYLKGAIVQAGRSMQDPRSPRKSAMDLLKAIVIPLTDLATLGKDTWDYLDQRRVVVQRSAVSRQRPAFNEGWRATFILQVQVPDYLKPTQLHKLLVDAGRLVGVGDFRPSYGRFAVVSFEVLKD